MVAWVNFISMIVSALLFLYFYIKSVGPAALEKKIGEIAYRKCTQYRFISVIFLVIHFAGYFVYFLYPLPIPIPRTFPWSWWISVLIAISISIPCGYLLWRAGKDAGEEAFVTKKEHTLFKGIYQSIRHPQAVGETPFSWVFALLLNSPFLALFSFIWILFSYLTCLAEEKDLVIRYGGDYLEYKRKTGFIIPKRGNKLG